MSVHLQSGLTFKWSGWSQLRSREEDSWQISKLVSPGRTCRTLYIMRWSCKHCNFTTSKRLQLIKHYRLNHLHSGQGRSIPCLYSDCPCSFKSWSALHTHLSRYRTQTEQLGQILSFSCLVCNFFSDWMGLSWPQKYKLWRWTCCLKDMENVFFICTFHCPCCNCSVSGSCINLCLPPLPFFSFSV